MYLSRLIATRLASCQFEEGLRNAADANGVHQRAKVQAMLMYYSCRMEAVSFWFSRDIRTLASLFRWTVGHEDSQPV